MATLVNLIRFLKRPTDLDGTCYVPECSKFFKKNLSNTNWKIEFLKKFLFFIFEKYWNLILPVLIVLFKTFVDCSVFLNLNIPERKRDNSIWKKDFYSKINKKYKYVLILLVWPQIHGKLSLKIGLDFSGASKTLFLTLFAHIFIESCSKTTYSYSARRDLSIGAWFDHIRKKIFLTIFDQRDPYQENWLNFFFFKYDQITHQLIDLVYLS